MGYLNTIIYSYHIKSQVYKEDIGQGHTSLSCPNMISEMIICSLFILSWIGSFVFLFITSTSFIGYPNSRNDNSI